MNNIELIKITRERIKNDLVETHKFNGKFMDKLIYGYPEKFVFTLSESEYYQQNKRVHDIALNIFDFVNLSDSETPSFNNKSIYPIDYIQVRETGTIEFNPIRIKYLTDDEVACAIGHEAAHLLCHHFELKKAMLNISRYNDKLFDSENLFFERALSRYIELEADKYGAVLSCRAGYNPYAYRTELFKYKFPMEKDINDLQFFADHPSMVDRLTFLDNQKTFSIDFPLEDFRKRIEKVKYIDMYGTDDEKIKMEVEFYKKFKSLFWLTNDGLIKRLNSIETLNDKKRLFQLERVYNYFLNLRKFEVDMRYPAHRIFIPNELNKSIDIIKKCQKLVKEKVSLKDKVKIIMIEVEDKIKEGKKSWSR